MKVFHLGAKGTFWFGNFSLNFSFNSWIFFSLIFSISEGSSSSWSAFFRLDFGLPPPFSWFFFDFWCLFQEFDDLFTFHNKQNGACIPFILFAKCLCLIKFFMPHDLFLIFSPFGSSHSGWWFLLFHFWCTRIIHVQKFGRQNLRKMPENRQLFWRKNCVRKDVQPGKKKKLEKNFVKMN